MCEHTAVYEPLLERVKELKKIKAVAIGINIAMILFGIFLVVFPMVTIDVLCWVVGVFVVFVGLMNIVGHFSKYDVERFYRTDFAVGILLCAFGVFLLIRSYLAVDILVIVLGLIIFVKNVMRLPGTFKLKMAGIKKWWLLFILNVLLCLIGIMMFVIPIGVARLVVILVGVAFIIDGVSDLIGTLVFSKKINLVVKQKSSRYIEADAEEKKQDD